ncbi:MAG TPA: molybdenum cofactor guanylyltransferase [Dehalococcoidia bacterium]|nr:molybdenum cofactor guanylyltransferase [Dehalococcoidia bacterium]
MTGDGQQIAGIVLAGGRSTRMGSDKASLVFDGRTLLQRTVDALSQVATEIVVVRAEGQQLPALNSQSPLIVVEDSLDDQGPLIGIAEGLRASECEVALVAACDMPFLRPQLLRMLVDRASAGRRFVVPMHLDRPQPLCSAFRRDALEVIDAQIAAGDRKIMAVGRELDADRVPPEQWTAADPDGRSFENVNTPEEFEAALARASDG